MLFVGLVKFKKKPTKAMIAKNFKKMETEKKEGTKVLGIYWTLGRYDSIVLYDAPNEKIAMKNAISRADDFEQETLVVIPAEEARKLVE